MPAVAAMMAHAHDDEIVRRDDATIHRWRIEPSWSGAIVPLRAAASNRLAVFYLCGGAMPTY